MVLLTTGKRDDLAFVRKPLRALLDDVAKRMMAGLDAGTSLGDIRSDWLAERETSSCFDWRYYLSRYAGARSSVGDGYFHNKAHNPAVGGFSYYHLRVLVGGDYTSHYRDALLRAAWVEGGFSDTVEEPDWYWNQKETWIDQSDPGMRLKESGAEVRCLDAGFQVDLPRDREDLAERLTSVLSQFAQSDGIVTVAQTPNGGRLVDTEDRVQLCIRLVNGLVVAGL